MTLTTPTVLNVSYYDDYAFIGTNGIDSGITAYDALTGFNTRYTTSAKAFLTGTLTAQLLPNGTVSSTYLYSVMYYDYKGRVIQAKGNNHLSGGTEKKYIAYNFTGQPLQKKHIHTATGKTPQTELYTYAYDEAGRLKTTQYSLNGGTTVTLASNTYDELGRLKTTTRNGLTALATTYTYNVRSWLKSSASPLFNQTLYYNDTYGGSTARYNGNIAAMSWKVSNETPTRGYKFTYDNLSRLTAAGYLKNGSANSHFNTSYAYDKQGNMTALTRGGNTGTSTYGTIDKLTMTYAGNQLIKAEDSGVNVNLSASMDFKNNSNAAREYSYDVNGNLTEDLNKGISSISYNLLNLPRTLSISNTFGSATNNYTYAADGRKLESDIGSKKTDYCENVIYENGVLKRILIEGGYVEGGTYYFYLTDHLGNNRVVANSSGSIVQSTHYYPFGMSFAEGTITSSQPYKYNGKELDTDRGLNLYDYSARYMDPGLGRFSTIDPMAEKYYGVSPYAYCALNPLRFIDPTGMVLGDPDFPMTEAYLRGLWNSVTTTVNMLEHPVETAKSIGNAILNPADTYHAISQQISETVNAVKNGDGEKIAYATGNILGGLAIGAGVAKTAAVVSKAAKAAIATNKIPFISNTITNSVPNKLARVIPNNIESKTLGAPGTADVFVTAADDIAGLNVEQIANRLTIPNSGSGFKIIEFNTPRVGLSSPINRTNPGFVGLGRTAGGAREFTLPNQIIPYGSTIKIIK